MKKITEQRRWSEEEDDYIRKSSGIKSSNEIAKKLSRTKGSVEQRACRMNISLAVGGRQWIPLKLSEVKQAVELSSHSKSKSMCALKMGVTYSRFSQLLKRAEKMGLINEKANVK